MNPFDEHLMQGPRPIVMPLPSHTEQSVHLLHLRPESYVDVLECLSCFSCELCMKPIPLHLGQAVRDEMSASILYWSIVVESISLITVVINKRQTIQCQAKISKRSINKTLYLIQDKHKGRIGTILHTFQGGGRLEPRQAQYFFPFSVNGDRKRIRTTQLHINPAPRGSL